MTMTREQADQRLQKVREKRLALGAGLTDHSPSDTPETWLQIAELHEEEARIWHDVWHDIVDDRGPGGGPTASLLTRAAIVAERQARDDARFWREQAERGAR